MREAERARILLRSRAGDTPGVQREFGISRVTIYYFLLNTLEAGTEAGVNDGFCRSKVLVITDADKTWVVHPACAQPKELGYVAEL